MWESVSKKRRMRKKRERELIYADCIEIERPILKDGKAVKMMKKLGLESFLTNIAVPRVDRSCCEEFISSCDADGSAGTVNGVTVNITPASIASVTGLPYTENAFHLRIKPQIIEHLKSVFPGFKRENNEVQVEDIVYGDEMETSALRSIIKSFMEKSMIQWKVVPSLLILEGIGRSLKTEARMSWASLLSHEMSKALRSTLRSRTKFYFGCWLTALIEHALEKQGAVSKDEDEQGKEQQLAEGEMHFVEVLIREQFPRSREHEKEEMTKKGSTLIIKESCGEGESLQMEAMKEVLEETIMRKEEIEKEMLMAVAEKEILKNKVNEMKGQIVKLEAELKGYKVLKRPWSVVSEERKNKKEEDEKEKIEKEYPCNAHCEEIKIAKQNMKADLDVVIEALTGLKKQKNDDLKEHEREKGQLIEENEELRAKLARLQEL